MGRQDGGCGMGVSTVGASDSLMSSMVSSGGICSTTPAKTSALASVSNSEPQSSG